MLNRIKYFDKIEFARQLETLLGDDIAIIVSDNLAEHWGIKTLLEEKAADGAVWIDKIDSNPDGNTIFSALKKLDFCVPKKIIAIGGGSTIDLAKAMITVLNCGVVDSSEKVIDVISKKEYLQNFNKKVSLIAVPTTAGTGSEVTSWGTVWDNKNKIKLSVDHKNLLPSEVWIVPELTTSLPLRATLTTGLDALCQACEAFWAKKSNPLAKELAIRAVNVIIQALPAVLETPQDVGLREKMLIGSLLSGLAFSQTRTTACHSISYPLTSYYGIEHGFAAVITLVPVAQRNAAAVDCGELFSAFAGASMEEWLTKVSSPIQPLRLSAFGVKKEDIKVIAENAFTAGRMDNNPVDFSVDDVVEILNQVF